MPLDDSTIARDARLIANNLEKSLKDHDPNAMHRAQLEILSILKDDPDAFKKVQDAVNADVRGDLKNDSAANKILGDFQLTGVDSSSIHYSNDANGGFNIKVGDHDSFDVNSANSYGFIDNGGTLGENDLKLSPAAMNADAARIINDILTGTDDSIHRAQMETMMLYKMTGGDKAQMNEMLTIVYQQLSLQPKGSQTANILKFGLMNLGNGCSPFNGDGGGRFDVNATATGGFDVSYVAADGTVTQMFSDSPTNNDFIRVDDTGVIKDKYDASTIEGYLTKTDDPGSWYEAGRELYSARKHLTDAQFNALCEQLKKDAGETGTKLPFIDLKYDGTTKNVIEVNMPNVKSQIFSQAIADGWFTDNFWHMLQSSEAHNAD